MRLFAFTIDNPLISSMEEFQAVPVTADPWTVYAFLCYLLLMIIIGIYSARFSSTGIGEFFIGGRKMKSFVVALSAVVSGRSAWLVLGVTGMAYVQGISAVWAIVGYTVVELYMFIYGAKRLRRYTERLDNVTVPDFFAARFRDTSNLLRITSGVVIIIFMVIYVAAQFDAGGKAFASSFGFTNQTGVFITAAIVLLYTFIGGFLAVSLTDVVQAVFMIVALFIMPIVAVLNYGGLTDLLRDTATIDAFMVDPVAIGIGGLIGYIGIGLGSPGNPHILARYMSIDDPKQLRVSAVIATIWNVLMGWGAVMIGIAGRAYYPEVGTLPLGDTEYLYPVLAQQLLHPIIFGFVLAAIIAAIMSTADSQLLVGASSCVRDIYQRVLLGGAVLTQRHLVFVSRVVILILVILALGLREAATDLVFWLVLFAWSGLGASFGPPLILSLFWARTTKWGVFAGLLSGTIVTIIWNQTSYLSNLLYELIPAFSVSVVAVILVSLLTKAPAGVREELELMKPTYKRRSTALRNSR
jgi:sodium/proline symporter